MENEAFFRIAATDGYALAILLCIIYTIFVGVYCILRWLTNKHINKFDMYAKCSFICISLMSLYFIIIHSTATFITK